MQTKEHVSPEEYERSYERLIARALPHVKGMILMTPYFMEPNRAVPMRARMDQYGEIVKRLAQRHALVFIDLQSAWDRIPPQSGVHMYIARQFLQAVGRTDKSALSAVLKI